MPGATPSGVHRLGCRYAAAARAAQPAQVRRRTRAPRGAGAAQPDPRRAHGRTPAQAPTSAHFAAVSQLSSDPSLAADPSARVPSVVRVVSIAVKARAEPPRPRPTALLHRPK